MDELFIMQGIIDEIRKDLRSPSQKHCESVYKTAKEAWLRPDVVVRLESSGGAKGSAESLIKYIDAYCRRYPVEGRSLFFDAALSMLPKC